MAEVALISETFRHSATSATCRFSVPQVKKQRAAAAQPAARMSNKKLQKYKIMGMEWAYLFRQFFLEFEEVGDGVGPWCSGG